MHANARGLAKLASIMANKGQTLMSEETWSVMHANSKTAMDAELSKWFSIFSNTIYKFLETQSQCS